MTAKSKYNRGSSTVEVAFIFPLAFLVMISVFAMSFHGVRGIIAQLAAMQAVRAKNTFQEDYLIQKEVLASLPKQFFSAGTFEIKGIQDNARLELNAISNSALTNISKSMILLKRKASIAPALPPSLGNAALQGGDTPSVYCTDGKGYVVCDN